jgi:hypothetical protein
VRIVAQELHMPVGILNPHQHHSKELQRYADTKGSFSKPAGW